MNNKPLVTVFGATGRQGGATARALLASGRWRVRATTRQPESGPALALKQLGADLCRADLDEAASLPAAFEGAHAVFAVTDFWAHRDALRELRQAELMAEAAADSPTLQHLIWSTLEDSRRVLPPLKGQRWSVPYMDAKAEANALFLDRDLPVTLLLTSFYWDNFISHGMGPQRAGDGVLELTLPLGNAPLPGISVADIGHCAAALFDAPAAQRRVGIAGEHLTGPAMAATFAEVLGEPVRWRDVPVAEYGLLPIPGATELAAMFAFKQRAASAYGAARPVRSTRVLHPNLLDFRAWLGLHQLGERNALQPSPHIAPFA
jgi:uncharacterized protein YbjT (DUF2867 family)